MRSFLISLLLATLTYASVGRITAINGDISVLRASKTIKASSGFALEEKDSIKSTKGSTAQLVFNDNTVITVGSNTTFSVQEYSSDASSPKARFAIAEGSFKTITGKIGKIAPDKFKMETKTATIGIRGTTLLGKVSSDGELTVACTRGAITVTPVPQISASGSGTQTLTASQTVVNQGQYTKSKNGNVEPPKQLTPGDLINLQGGLAPLARNNTQTTEPQGGSTNETPTAPQNNVGQNSVPNVDTVKDLTSKAADVIVNNSLKEQTQAQTITAAYIDSLSITKFSQLPATDTYVYTPLKTGNVGLGYADLSTQKAFYSSFIISDNKIIAEFGFGGISAEDATDNAKLNFLYTGLGDYSYSIEGSPLYTTYGLYGGELTGYLKGGTALYGKLTETSAYQSNLDTYIVGKKYSNTAPVVDGFEAYSSSAYEIKGQSIGFSIGENLLASATLINTYGGGNEHNKSLSISADKTTGSIDATYSPLVSPGTSVFVSEDAFGLAGNGGVLTTVSDLGGSDYASWGYWYKVGEMNDVEFGFWVGGALTPNANVPTSGSATYSGKVLGGVASSNGLDLINTATSSVNLAINFGSNNVASGNISFSTVGGQSWNLNVDSATSSISRAAISGNSGFGASFDAANSSSNVGSINSGVIAGNFYGPNAQTVGGSFKATAGMDNAYTAAGVFKANK